MAKQETWYQVTVSIRVSWETLDRLDNRVPIVTGPIKEMLEGCTTTLGPVKYQVEKVTGISNA